MNLRNFDSIFVRQGFFFIIDLSAPQEVVDLYDAITYNTQKTLEEKKEFLSEKLQPLLEDGWVTIRRTEDLLLNLFKALASLQENDEQIWKPVLEGLKKNKKVSNDFYIVRDIYETLSSIQKNQTISFDFTPEIEHWKLQLTNNDDFTYRYNVEEQRMYTFKELKAQRDIIRYPDQMIRLDLSKRKEIDQGDYDESEEMGEEEKQALQRDDALNEIVKERFLSIMRGDSTFELDGIVDEPADEDEDRLLDQLLKEDDDDEDEKKVTKTVKKPKIKKGKKNKERFGHESDDEDDG